VTAMALNYMEYQQRYGCTRADMATLVVQLHQNVQAIPQAYWSGQELTFDDYMSCRVIAEPMCLFDADIPVDGSGSVVLTSAERAKDLAQQPVYVTAWAGSRMRRPWPVGTVDTLDEQYDRGFDVGRQLWSQSGWRPEDVRVVQTYDGFVPMTLFWLETLGVCPVGEAWQFIQGGRIDPKGEFPLLSGGGNQGWGRLHGFPHVFECYLQLAGRAGDRQIADATTGLSSFSFPDQAGGRAILYSNDPDA
jgi:acetyl-CoA acetyltransferase